MTGYNSHMYRYCKKCGKQVWWPAVKRGQYKSDDCKHTDLSIEPPPETLRRWKLLDDIKKARTMIERELSIELSVKLSDGSFDTTVRLPVQANEQDRNAVVAAWFELIQKALKLAKVKEPSKKDPL